MRWEQVPEIPLFSDNTAAFIHDLPAEAIPNPAGASGYARLMAAPPSPALSASQLATLAGLGEERTAGVGDVLYRLGDATYPFIAIREGEVAILDAAGNEIVRHGASSFLGELNLLSGL